MKRRHKITDIMKTIARPVTYLPVLFCLITVCSAAVPIVFSLLRQARIFHFILSSAMQGAALAYLLCLLVTCIPKGKWRTAASLAIGVPVALWAIVEIGCISTVGRPLDVDTATVMIETDTSETSSFFSQYMTWEACLKILAGIAFLAAIIIGVSWLIKKFRTSAWMATVTSVAVGATMIGGSIELYRLIGFEKYDTLQEVNNWYATGESENPMLIHGNYILYGNSLVKGAYIAKIFGLESDDMKRWVQVQRQIWDEEICTTDTASADIDIALIIGESFIRAHSSLYGYRLNTNPRLRQEADSGRLAVFEDIITPANFTTIALRNILNLNNVSAGEKWCEAAYLPLLMKKGGWNVYHYDNQTASRSSDVGISRMFYADIICDKVLDDRNERMFPYDGQFVEAVGNRLKEKGKPGRRFVIYHLWGQHFDCRDRYEGTPFFKESDITTQSPWIGGRERQAIADYNNATRYNDSIVERIIDDYRKRKAVVIYLSDHGEDSPELAPVMARNVPRPDDPAWIDRQFHIPFMVWMSDSFIETSPEKAEKIRNAVGRPWSTDNLGQMILGLSGLRTEYYRNRLDILSDSFTPYERTTASGYPYDSISSHVTK